LPAIIDLAWQLSGGDVDFVKQVIHPEVPASFQALADFFKRHGAVAEAIEMLAASGSSGEQSRRQYLGQLITDRRFTDAYALWSTMHPGNVPGTLVDPGFEREQDLTDPGFGWRSANKSASLALSLDTEEPRDGHSSLRIDFNGESDPGMSIISQLVLIEPNTRYYLRFSYRADRIISGGRPNAIVLDARDKTVLGQSGALAATTDGWRDIAIGFHSTQSMEAVEVALRRDRCDKSPCPIFGRLWLDSFSLQKQ
jgi:hypothetical protein